MSRPSRLADEAAALAIDLALGAGGIALAPWIAWRLARVRRWRSGLWSRLSLTLPPRAAAGGLWVHAVSAGELLSAEPLLRALRAAVGDLPIALSVTTEAAHLLAGQKFPELPRFFWPLDCSAIVRRVLARVRPRAVVLIELELWPNFLLSARRFGIPTLVVNGRISGRGFSRWQRFRPVARWLFGLIDHYAVQNAEYAGRLAALGVPPGRVSIGGNMKFDVPRDEAAPPSPVRDRLSGGAGQPLVVAGCTHPGEEAMLLRLLPRLGAASLVLAPRHLERVAEVLALVRSSGFVPVTLGGTGTGQVLVVDAFGKLEALYRAADVVVMGGTFAPHGGHNMLEPARWGKPVVLGPSIDNFRDIALGLLARQAAVRVGGEQELEVALRALLEDAGRRGAVGERALAVWRDGRGATERYVRAIVKALEKERSDDG